ncbi:hypothetical protein AGIG_G3641 [Arapaima gigas]
MPGCCERWQVRQGLPTASLEVTRCRQTDPEEDTESRTVSDGRVIHPLRDSQMARRCCAGALRQEEH